MTTANIQEVLSPPSMQDDFTRELVTSAEYGFRGAKRLGDGTYVGIKLMITTVAIVIRIDKSGYVRRYCYTDMTECLSEYEKLSERLAVPEGWVAKKP